MSYYFIAQIKINNTEEYQKYIDKAGKVFSKYNGEYLAIDNNPKVLEGSWDYTRAVLIRFNTETDFNNWYYSKEYQEILEYRLNASHCDTLLVKRKD